MFTVRPLAGPDRSELKGAFRVYLSPSALLSLKLRAGDSCQLRLEEGSAPKPAIAWNAPQKMQDSVVQTTRTLQELYGLRIGDNIIIEKSQRPLVILSLVKLWEVTEGAPSLSEDSRLSWETYLQGELAKIEVLTSTIPIKIGWQGQKRAFQVDRSTSSYPQLFKVSSTTKINIGRPGTENERRTSFGLDREGLEWLSEQIGKINRVLRNYGPDTSFHELPLFYGPKQGILLYGPKGTGKSLLIKKIADCGWGQVVKLTADSLRSPMVAFDKTGGPTLFIISKLENVAPANSSDSRISNESARILELFDEIRGSQALIVAEARHPNAIDESLRSIDCFHSEIEIPVPNAIARHQILRAIRSNSDQPNDDLLEDMASRTHGYVGADLLALIREAVESARDRQEKLMEMTVKLNEVHLRADKFDEKRPLPQSEKSQSDPPDATPGTTTPELHEPLSILAEDITAAFSQVRPSAMQEIFLETPNVRWSDIGGLHEIKERLQLAIEEPLKMADTMARFNIKPAKGALLYGPPGCSKTLLVKALATEAGLNFLAVKGAEIVSMYVGESERAIREIFRKARAASPSIIFFDEFDAIASSKQKSELKVLETLLNEMDGFEELRDVFVVAATNKPQAIDPALLRPGRFDNVVYVGLPDLETRKAIIQLWFDKSVVVVDDWDLADVVDSDDEDATAAGALAAMAGGYSGAEIVNICQNAAIFAMRGKRNHVAWADLVKALHAQPHSVSKEMIESYERWGNDRR